MKMAIILNIQVYLCMFFAFLHTEGTRNKKENKIIIHNFLRHPGWNNINDVESITYRNKTHKLNDLISETVTSLNCDTCIRQATIFLGCSYASDLDLMNTSFTKFQELCFEQLGSSYANAYSCTVTLLMKMIEIVPMAKYMKGALDALEKYHTVYPISVRRNRLILINLLTKIQEEQTFLTKLITSSLSIKVVLKAIAKILSARSDELGADKSFCKLIYLDSDSVWNLWVTESNTLIQQRKYQELFIILSDKISNFIQTTITKKYSELGFIYDWNTSQTFLPVQPSSSDNHDIAQNRNINCTLNTNYVDTKEAIPQNDITACSSVQHNNNVKMQEDIKEENNNCEVNDDSDVLINYPNGQEPFNQYL